MLVLADAGHWFVIHFLNHVSAIQVRLGSRAALIHVVHHHAADTGRQLELFCNIRR